MRIITSNKIEQLRDNLFASIKKDLERVRAIASTGGDSKTSGDVNSPKRVILVVPAQESLSIEEKALEALDCDGFFDLQIVRGQKLAANILGECGGIGRTSVNSIGRNMLLRKISAEHKDDFLRFGKVCDSSDFLDMAGDFIVQLKQNNIGTQELNQLKEDSPKDSLLFEKLSDLNIIYGEYENILSDKFSDSEDLTAFVTSKVKDSTYVKESIIYFFDFYLFTKRELDYLSELNKYSCGLNMLMLCGEEDFYEVTRKTINKIRSLIPCECINAATDKPGTNNGSTPLGKKTGVESELKGLADDGAIKIVRCANPYVQAESIASEIKRLIREEAYSYADISVLTSAPHINTIKRVFEYLDVPAFVDEKKSLLSNRFISAISSVLNIATENYMPFDVMSLLKSGLTENSEDYIEAFEHYIKKYHIKADKFKSPFKYGKTEEGFVKFEEIRSDLFDMVNPFTVDINAAKTTNDKIKVLYNFLQDKLHLAERIESEASDLAEDGYLDASQEMSQLFDTLIGVFDQMSELIGSEPITTEAFSEILTKSFSDIKVGVLPQAAGKVVIGDITRSMPNTKAVFVAGFNEGVIPSDVKEEGLLTQRELSQISEHGFTLAKTVDGIADEELFCVCRALISAKKYLGLYYTVSDSEGSDQKSSYLLDQIRDAFKIKETEDIQENPEGLAYLEGRSMALPKLARVIRESLGGEELPSVWKLAFNVLNEDEESKTSIDILKSGVNYNKNSAPLGKEIAKLLFSGDRDYSFSPTRMDNFSACPFKHFVNYGLSPKTEEDFSIGGAEIGRIHHDALLKFCERLTKPCRSAGVSVTDSSSPWMKITDDEIEKIFDEIISELSEKILDGLMTSSKEEMYRTERVKRVCVRFAKQIVEKVRDGSVDEMYFETKFARGCSFPAIEINTASGKAYIEGQIDRIDVLPQEDGKHIRIIDYKSGNTRFDKYLIEQGLMLQLMIYLEGAMGNYADETPGSIYYFRIKEPQAMSSLNELPADEISEDILEKINKEYKLEGMEVSQDFRLKFKETLSGLCEKLMAGNINIEPKKIKSTYDSCRYCEFSSICQKDIK